MWRIRFRVEIDEGVENIVFRLSVPQLVLLLNLRSYLCGTFRKILSRVTNIVSSSLR
jgi:hypothetical protein